MTDSRNAAPPPGKGPKRPYGYSEDVDEAPGQLEEEPVDVEESTPAAERESVEAPPEDEKVPPVFEE